MKCDLRMGFRFVLDSRVLLLMIFLKSGYGKQNLKCYNCWWSNSEIDTIDSEEEKPTSKDRDLPYPVVDTYIGDLVTSLPTRQHLDKYCEKESCNVKSEGYCLRWSYISGSPINITYKCVGNPSRKSGCYQQEIKTKEYKQYVKVEACLCNKDFCNSAPSPLNSLVILASQVLIILLLTK